MNGGGEGGSGISYSDSDADPTDNSTPRDPLDAKLARTDPHDDPHPAERAAGGGEPVVTEASADQTGTVAGEHGFSEVSPDTRQAD